jgi:hypothetical protein
VLTRQPAPNMTDAVPVAAPVEAPPPEPAPAPPPAPGPAPTPRRAAPRPAVPKPVEAAAEPAPTAGELHITSDVAGAQVFIDRVFLGTTPVTASGVTPGSHTLNVTAQGYDGIERTITVAAGTAELPIAFKEVRLNASIDVVHKHRMGSCEGKLVATQHALQYVTTNKSDAFSVPLTDIQNFEIDYLKKNLTMKVKGKTYNFTDPKGNADPLFVFHRDVDKARQRLAAGDPAARD